MARFHLTITSERGESQNYPLQPGAKYVLGRLDTCDIGVNDALLSRRHCEFVVTGRGAILRDLQSQNGTYLNGARIQEEVVLPGDHVQIGRTRILFSCTDDTATSTTSTLPRPTLFKEDPPPRMGLRPCSSCGAELTNHDLLGHTAFQTEDGTICLKCFCEGEGDFASFGRYRLYRKLGSGGMATVYMAIHLPLRKPVAIKVFKELEGVGEKALQRFLREGRTGARLTHPNIVQYLDAGTEQGKHYIAMEYVDGLDTRQRLFRAGFFQVLDALLIVRQVADALHFAHEHGAVHRDIKPENIIISRQGDAKLTDFGLAKFLNEIGGSDITESGSWVGTLAYTPPEQLLDSRSADRRSDIYALAATFFEYISGKVPFPGEFNRTTVLRIQNEPPPIDAIDCQAITPQTREILRKGLAKKPDDRYQTAADLILAIDAARDVTAIG
ncbi:MAG: protein kinase [Planctomycetes bacterium]|nr:protein kinase [Planctomycetota bacterium]